MKMENPFKSKLHEKQNEGKYTWPSYSFLQNIHQRINNIVIKDVLNYYFKFNNKYVMCKSNGIYYSYIKKDKNQSIHITNLKKIKQKYLKCCH